MGMWSMGKLNYAYHLYYGAMNNQERIAPNKLLQPTVYAVSICVHARFAPIFAHKQHRVHCG